MSFLHHSLLVAAAEAQKNIDINPENPDIDVLPENLECVEYLQGDGKAWMNLEYLPSTTTSVEMVLELEFGTFFYGTRKQQPPTLAHNGICTTSNMYYQYSDNQRATNFLASKIYNGRKIWYYNCQEYGSSSEVREDGTKGEILHQDTTRVKTAFTTTLPMFLFGLNHAGSIESRIYTGKIYWFKVYEGDNNPELVMSLIPVVDNEGRGFMYDLVGGGIYGNLGSGAFGHGPKV